jgi:hypothetical protein
VNAFDACSSFDSALAHLQVFALPSHALMHRLGKPIGTKAEAHDSILGFLHHPWSVAISKDSETIAVSDSFNHCVQLFSSSSGRCLGLISRGKGFALGCMHRPSGLAWDSDNNLFVADSANHRVQVSHVSSHYPLSSCS